MEKFIGLINLSLFMDSILTVLNILGAQYPRIRIMFTVLFNKDLINYQEWD